MNGKDDRGEYRHRRFDPDIDRRRVYAVTLKQTGKNDTQVSELLEAKHKVLISLRPKHAIPYSSEVFERDSQGKLHAHYSIRSRSFQYTKFQLKGWHVHYLELKSSDDIRKWDNYLKKCPLKLPVLQQEETINYYSSNNGFIS